jgi:phosphoribosylaminoimidazole-succinocarboxamide synthase
VISTISAPELPVPRLYSGKVRDTYDLGGDRLLMVASDRISAFDVILPTSIAGKGEVLTQLSLYWFQQMNSVVQNHLTGELVADLGWDSALTSRLASRSMIVQKADRVPVECVVRGYLAGSAWVEYQKSGTVAGHTLPSELQLSSQLPTPIFTPARKSDAGHDENITRAQLRDDIGAGLAARLEELSIAIYRRAAGHAAKRGVIIADTKFEFGFINGTLALIDELITPDSSRFWDATLWRPGRESDSWDKQYVRNWLLGSGWNREAPGPKLPIEVVDGTRRRYREAFQRITGVTINQWLSRETEEPTA